MFGFLKSNNNTREESRDDDGCTAHHFEYDSVKEIRVEQSRLYGTSIIVELYSECQHEGCSETSTNSVSNENFRECLLNDADEDIIDAISDTLSKYATNDDD